ncbi:flocculation-associated PEP-CTERM protein PepA [Methylomonas sp. LL1]|uniref:flocculation-associated PEP-CTERM protein PepA n=1 Tax=Methylomonas sp. LL1 TaxID=2785785 RepID=UPI0018C378E6|nr:flocculation-associated PEP-CTERM protein PepA [Methylomonas sp. LL1]QPK64722.1 flocculation-associated PEP-CTERM protein PepA [Methylomonas sp. LL1]
MNSLYKQTLIAAAITFSSASSAFASLPWIGSADYLAAPGAQNDEALVGPFDTYDFGAGIGLIVPDSSVAVGNTFSGWIQTMVNSHILGGTGISVPQLNTTGTGGGFELTVISQFSGTYTSLIGGLLGFTIDSGTASMMFDSNPNFSFANDTGFSDGNAILTGGITGGSGFVNMNVGYGFEAVSLGFTGALAVVDPNVYSPSTIDGGTALFSITALGPFTSTPVISQVIGGDNSVMGNSAVNGQLFELDGKLQLTAVPVPTSAWLFLSGMMGLLAFNRKKPLAA